MSPLFKLRNTLPAKWIWLLEGIGLFLLLLIWYLLSYGDNPWVPGAILPAPVKVMEAIPLLFTEYDIIQNISKSLGLNLGSYIEAIAIALPLGYIIGLFPVFKFSLSKPIDALRFVPLTAVTGLFIVWFGIGSSMKLHFLAFGILIYLLPVVVQRIQELDDIYVKTVYTLGANNWQTIKTVFIPGVISRLSDDIRVLTAISWTYIIIAESLGNQGGIGALIWRVGQRQQRVDVLFALVFIIILIGFIQDKLFVYADKVLFPYKHTEYNRKTKDHKTSTSFGLIEMLKSAIPYMVWLVLIIYAILALDEYLSVLGGIRFLSYLFDNYLWSVHVLMVSIALFQINLVLKKKEIVPIKQN
jgi:ABC-type nitrate/sulfonate/bicarbonate transport system permease component